MSLSDATPRCASFMWFTLMRRGGFCFLGAGLGLGVGAGLGGALRRLAFRFFLNRRVCAVDVHGWRCVSPAASLLVLVLTRTHAYVRGRRCSVTGHALSTVKV